MKSNYIIPCFIFMLHASCSENSSSNNYNTVEVMPDTAFAAVEESQETVAPNKNIPESGNFINLHGETDIEKLLCQGWVMDDDVSVLTDNSGPEGFYPYRCFYFFDDHTYTRNVRNEMEYGNWFYDSNIKKFSVHPTGYGSRDEYKLAAIGPDDMIILNRSEGSLTKLTCLADGVRYKNKYDDPYYIANNRWRIKSKYSETDEQVRQRLKGFINFHILFYRDNLERKEKTISFYGFPTCLKWYGGGIGLINEEDLPDNWFACFYNKEQALKAQRMMKNCLSKKYNWSNGNESWVKKNLEVLEQMYANL